MNINIHMKTVKKDKLSNNKRFTRSYEQSTYEMNTTHKILDTSMSCIILESWAIKNFNMNCEFTNNKTKITRVDELVQVLRISDQKIALIAGWRQTVVANAIHFV